MAHPGGRPLLFKTVEDLERAIKSYFDDCDPHTAEEIYYEYHQIEEVNAKGEKYMVNDTSRPPIKKTRWIITTQKPYLITGLANFLNTSRETLINYEERPEFFDAIKKAKDKCEQYWESTLLGNQVAGTIFSLKNNYGWVDKQELDQTTTHKGSINVSELEQTDDEFLKFLEQKKKKSVPTTEEPQ